jgi:hypothetical protein
VGEWRGEVKISEISKGTPSITRRRTYPPRQEIAVSKKNMKHPSDLKNFKRGFSQNGIHVYEISKRQARKVMKEFPEFFPYNSSFKGVKRLFYLDARGSNQPVILGLE